LQPFVPSDRLMRLFTAAAFSASLKTFNSIKPIANSDIALGELVQDVIIKYINRVHYANCASAIYAVDVSRFIVESS
jgi:predicted house-cleaning NTP pyrophosphatase (Maf/HAM1 superfamily)